MDEAGDGAHSTACSTPRVVAAEAPQVTTNPLSQAYYVDLHLHTSYSLDTCLSGAMGVDPDTPYCFARGEVVDYRANLDTGRALQPRRW